MEWTGDVWKHAFELASSDDIDFRIIKADYGLGILRLRKPNPVMTLVVNPKNERS